MEKCGIVSLMKAKARENAGQRRGLTARGPRRRRHPSSGQSRESAAKFIRRHRKKWKELTGAQGCKGGAICDGGTGRGCVPESPTPVASEELVLISCTLNCRTTTNCGLRIAHMVGETLEWQSGCALRVPSSVLGTEDLSIYNCRPLALDRYSGQVAHEACVKLIHRSYCGTDASG